MRCFSCMHSSFAAKHVDGLYGQNVQFWSHLTIALSSSHNSNEVWQAPDSWFCLLCSVRAVFVPPFQRVSWYGGAIVCFF
uniref:Uncharacterized protein n=1 Tax=Anguilla anguilla TaxID=7936 RepID=A0A0E9Y0L7_ANGAN